MHPRLVPDHPAHHIPAIVPIQDPHNQAKPSIQPKGPKSKRGITVRLQRRDAEVGAREAKNAGEEAEL